MTPDYLDSAAMTPDCHDSAAMTPDCLASGASRKKWRISYQNQDPRWSRTGPTVKYEPVAAIWKMAAIVTTGHICDGPIAKYLPHCMI